MKSIFIKALFLALLFAVRSVAAADIDNLKQETGAEQADPRYPNGTVFIRPNTSFGKYRSFVIDPVGIDEELKKDSLIKPSMLDDAAAFTRQEFAAKLKPAYEITSEPRADAMRLSLKLVQSPEQSEFKVRNLLPIFMIVNVGKAIASHGDKASSGVTLEGELRDASSGLLLVAFVMNKPLIDPETATSGSLPPGYKDAVTALAVRFRQEMDQMKAGTLPNH